MKDKSDKNPNWPSKTGKPSGKKRGNKKTKVKNKIKIPSLQK